MHCGLCLNACPTYRELGLEMDSPRGRVYQMVQVANGAPITPIPTASISICAWPAAAANRPAPRACRYGRMVEDARAEIEAQRPRGLARAQAAAASSSATCCNRAARFRSPARCSTSSRPAGSRRWCAAWAQLKLLGRLGDLEQLTPSAEPPFFFSQIGRTFPAGGRAPPSRGVSGRLHRQRRVSRG